ncbi:hypothetical protein ACFV4T_35120, partial [Streptomyces sp. NPDC059755]
GGRGARGARARPRPPPPRVPPAPAAREPAEQGGPAGSGRYDSLLRGILLLVLDRLDDYREAHFTGR